MPRSSPCFPRHRFPAPITTATSTPNSKTSLILLAMASASSTSIPKPDLPTSASPLNLRRTRLYLTSLISLLLTHPGGWGYKKTNRKVGLFQLIVQALAQLPSLEAAHDHIFTNGGHRLKDQFFDRQRFVTDVGLTLQDGFILEFFETTLDDLLQDVL